MNLLEIPVAHLMQKVNTKHLNAVTKGMDSDLSTLKLKDLLSIIGDGRCHYTGEEFKDLHDASFERINPSKGYVKGNVVMVKLHINNLKGITLDRFVKDTVLTYAIKVKLLRKALYQVEKLLKG